MPQINTSLITSLPGDDIASRDLNFSNVGQAFQAGLDQSDPLRRLRQLGMEQELEMRSLQISKTMEDRQTFLDAEKAAREIAPGLRAQISSGNSQGAYQAWLSELARNPSLAASPTYNTTGKAIEASMTFSEKLADNAERKRHNEALEKRYTTSPAALEAQDFAAAQAALRTEESKLLEAGTGEETPEIRAQKDRIQSAKDVVTSMEGRRDRTEKFDQRLFRLTTERDDAIDAGDVELAKRLQDQINYIQSQHRNPRLEEQLRDIRGMRQATYKALLTEKPGSAQHKALTTKMEELEGQMRSLLSDGASAPAGPKPFVWTPGGVKPK